jgi:hypothetical protein
MPTASQQSKTAVVGFVVIVDDRQGPYHLLEYSQWLSLIEADDLILWQLMSEIRCKSSQRIAVALQRTEKFRAWLVHHSRRDICENLPVCCFVTTTMGRPKEDDPNSTFADRRVLRLDPS